MSRDTSKPKHSRPTVWLKQVYPEIYSFYFAEDPLGLSTSTSKKGRENDGYWFFARGYLRPIFYGENETDHPPSFFWKTLDARNNKGTVIEMGRLLLTLMQCDQKEWAVNVCTYVFKAYNKKQQAGQEINDAEYKNALQHIRENVGYYFNNEAELKLFILQKFFGEQLQTLLPEKPEELKQLYECLSFVEEIRKTQRAKGVEHWIKAYENLEEYIFYVTECLENMGISDAFMTLEQWKEEQEKECKEYASRIGEIKAQYKATYIDSIRKIDLS